MIGWEDRLREEYSQLKERVAKLHTENAKRQHVDALMKKQEEIMRWYMQLLEIRAEMEGIDL